MKVYLFLFVIGFLWIAYPVSGSELEIRMSSNDKILIINGIEVSFGELGGYLSRVNLYFGPSSVDMSKIIVDSKVSFEQVIVVACIFKREFSVAPKVFIERKKEDGREIVPVEIKIGEFLYLKN